MAETIKGNWSNESAFNLVLALAESRNWIEAVVGQKFPSDDFQQSLKNGVFLCKLINQIQPNIVKKINTANSDFAQRENLSLFIKAAKELGLRDTQVFDTNDLFESKRIRNVAIALYWLGRAARGIPTYKGPQLNLLAFKKMNCSACKKPIEDNNYLATIDQQFHTKCAHCCVCHEALNPAEPFYQNGDKIYCPNCMVAANKGVGQGGKGGKAGHDHGHDHCAGCHKNMDGQDYVPEGDKKYCTNCVCDLCHDPLIGNFSVKNGKKYCDTCTCFDCGCPLQEGFFEEGNLRFCEPCHNKHQKSAGASDSNAKPSSASSSRPPTLPPRDQQQKPSNSNANAQPTPCCKACDKPITGKPQKGGDRNKYCPTHENDYCCTACDKEMSGQVVEDKGKRYHPACHKGNKSGAPGGAGGKRTCGGCSRPIESGPAVEALDKMWHPKCFKCAKCGNDFPDGSYSVGPDGKPYCSNCDSEDGGEAEICHGCKKQLSGQVTQVFGKMWHQGCLKCRKCGDKFVTGYFDFEGIPYCKPCHQVVSKADTCTKCNKVIEGECVKFSEKLYHKSCFVCTDCSKPLGKDDILSKYGKPVCRSCHAKDKVVCAKCRDPIAGEVAQVDNKTYCSKCAPVKSTNIYGERKAGFTIDPRSGKKTFH